MFTNQELTVDQVKALLGPPPLMLAESEEEYWKWWTALVEPDKPKSFLAWLEVNELAYKEWEQKRLRRYRPALVKRALISALSSLLLGLYDGIGSKLARDYFGNDATEQRKAREIVASYGITEEQIVAEAMVKRGAEMLILDRMDSNRASASRPLRKAIDRRAETGRIPPEQIGDQA
jgi:cell wall-associated NlpC family hydrolase